MKKIIFNLLMAVMALSCGGGDDSKATPEPVNSAPSKPTLSVPTNNLLCINNMVAFQWNASTDPEGNSISYQIQIAKDNQFSQIVETITAAVTNQSFLLEKGVAYYWRVKAIDSNNKSSDFSSTFQFYTEGVGVSNHLPFTATIVSPQLNALVQGATTLLEWNASDVDSNDVLTYDVYFGTVNPPTTKVSSNQTTKTRTENISAATNYYWRVDVKDNKGGVTKGQVWNFKTN